MSLTLTYTSLIAMIQTWAEDNDTEFTTALDNIIGLGETRLLRDLNLEIFDTTATGNFSSGSQTVTKPSDILAVRSFTYTNASSEQVFLTRKTYDYINMYWPNVSSVGTPLYYAEIDETTWRVSPTPSLSSAYEVRYNARPTGLSSSNATSWLGTNAADLLFKACMIESSKYVKHDMGGAGPVARFEADYLRDLPLAKRELMRMERSDYRPLAPATSAND